MSQYLLVLRDPVDSPFFDLSPAEIQAIIARYKAWSDGLRADGRLVGSHKLRDGEGRVVARADGKVVVTDGPYLETKEVVGGYFLIEAASYEEAVAVARTCPHVEFGTTEVRAIEML